jgi:hypothetical protein
LCFVAIRKLMLNQRRRGAGGPPRPQLGRRVVVVPVALDLPFFVEGPIARRRSSTPGRSPVRRLSMRNGLCDVGAQAAISLTSNTRCRARRRRRKTRAIRLATGCRSGGTRDPRRHCASRYPLRPAPDPAVLARERVIPADCLFVAHLGLQGLPACRQLRGCTWSRRGWIGGRRRPACATPGTRYNFPTTPRIVSSEEQGRELD